MFSLVCIFLAYKIKVKRKLLFKIYDDSKIYKKKQSLYCKCLEHKSHVQPTEYQQKIKQFI